MKPEAADLIDAHAGGGSGDSPGQVAASSWIEVIARGRFAAVILVLFCAVLFVPGIAEIPVLDRDEGRFVQATTQMLDSGDFVNIRFQDEARHQKPVGIYWLQSASVALFGGPEAAQIWAYRLVSVVGATLGVLFTWLAGRVLFNPTIAFAGAALMAASVVLVGEAHIAKTDAALFAAITGMQACLARLYVDGRAGNRGPLLVALGFWLALGVGILLKGPIAPMVGGLTLVSLLIMDRSWSLLTALRPLWGVSLMLVIVAPWFIAIQIETAGAFASGSLGRDFLDKLLGAGIATHQMPPGYFLLLVGITLWPASLFLWPALAAGVRSRAGLSLRFCLAWLVLPWLAFELAPSKLPHYTLPLYPALALLIAWAALGAGGRYLHRWWAWGLYGLWGVGTVAAAIAIVIVPGSVGGTWLDGIAPALVMVAGAGLTLWALWRRRHTHAVAGMLVTALSLPLLASITAPALDNLWVTRAVSAQVAAIDDGAPMPIVSAGFHEPSLVFRLGTDTVLGNGDQAARFLADMPNGLALIESREMPAFLAAVDALALEPVAVGRAEGLNYSKGDRVEITLFRLHGGE